jgi:hypothetical protein
MGVWDVDGWLAQVDHAQVVDWVLYRNERVRRATALSKKKQTLATYR